jgi:hypothetical protein
MATFRVGQRVRVVHASDYIQRTYGVIGREATVLATDSTKHAGHPIVIDIDGLINQHPNGVSCSSYHIVPLQPESNQITTWEECPWQPEHLRETQSDAVNFEFVEAE